MTMNDILETKTIIMFLVGFFTSLVSYQALTTQVDIQDLLDYGFAVVVALYLLKMIGQYIMKKMDKIGVNVEKVVETQKYIVDTLKDITETLRQISETNQRIIYMIERMDESKRRR